jgi:hypothetical protein
VKIDREADDAAARRRHAAQAMTNKRPTPPLRPKKEPGTPLEPSRRFDRRSDGRFDLPVIVGRTPQQVARRLA